MKTSFAVLAVFALPLACTSTPERAATTEAAATSTPVMVLGTYHMDNPGADLVNLDPDDVLAPARQAQLEAVVRRLAGFRPTTIMVEAQSDHPDLLDTGYLKFAPEQLKSDRNEITQVAYRLAHALGIQRVYGVDTRKGEIDFFPFDQVQSFEAAKGIAMTGPMIAKVQAEAVEFAQAQKAETISQLLARQNDPAQIAAQHNAFYYGLLRLADAENQPGARLNYGWYARNALIFGKIASRTRPGDRVLVLYGAGHAYWLRHFAANTPGFSLVEPADYLED